eukprot:8631377-Alexandrium_andersonii.AAC.1
MAKANCGLPALPLQKCHCTCVDRWKRPACPCSARGADWHHHGTAVLLTYSSRLLHRAANADSACSGRFAR